jgi:hypothetical protein
MFVDVKKWDKQVGIEDSEAVFHDMRLGMSGFSKTWTGLKWLERGRMGRISTFQATTTTATSIYYF